jgi:hypothetical protein
MYKECDVSKINALLHQNRQEQSDSPVFSWPISLGVVLVVAVTLRAERRKTQ